MASLANSFITPEEYLALDRKAQVKSEYYAGQVFAFAGASKAHNLIVANVIAGLHRQLVDRPSSVYPSDMRVKVSKTGLYAYPNVVVTCGEERFDDQQNDILLNPIVLVEVLSESTSGYDRGEKFEHYRRLESLREYLLITQQPYRADHYGRQNDVQWLMSEISGPDAILTLNSIHCELTLKEIYAKLV